MARRPTLEFLKTESGAGLVLTVAAAAALAMANSHWAPAYFAFVNHPIPVRVGDFAETRTVLGWVKDGLMAIFFLVVGMEIKFEVRRRAGRRRPRPTSPLPSRRWRWPRRACPPPFGCSC